MTLEMNADRQSNPSDLAALGHLPLHKGGLKARANFLIDVFTHASEVFMNLPIGDADDF